jgi:hypothetical protein
MRHLFCFALLSLVAASATAQPPRNPALADSPWPVFHHDSYASASTLLRGPEPGDRIAVQTIPTDLAGASPWTLFSARYRDGSRAVYGATLRGVYKARIDGAAFDMIDVWEPMRWRGFLASASVMYNIAVLRDGALVVPDPRRRRFYRLVDRDAGNSRSPLRLDATFTMPDAVPGQAAQMNIAPDGSVIALTDRGWLIAIAPDFRSYRSFDLSAGGGDLEGHNAFPIDEDGNIYIVSWRSLTKIRWSGSDFRIVWRAPYDFLGPGCANRRPQGSMLEVMRVLRGGTCTGSGTTPTLVGSPGDDRLVVVTDGHQPSNNLVAFWRDAPPADWRPLPGQDARVAGIARLPYATPLGDGFSVENSPAALGYDVYVAQWGGIDPRCDQPRGVQMVRWLPRERRLAVVWSNPDVAMNGVITASAGSNLIYSSGRIGCTYTFFGLDRLTGAVRIRQPLGNDAMFVDGGNNISLNDDRSLVYGSGRGIVRLRPDAR